MTYSVLFGHVCKSLKTKDLALNTEKSDTESAVYVVNKRLNTECRGNVGVLKPAHNPTALGMIDLVAGGPRAPRAALKTKD
jgi:hypothetical protein